MSKADVMTCSLQGSVSRAIRLKDSSRRWLKTKTACLRHLCVTETGLLGGPVISVRTCTQTEIQPVPLIGTILRTTGEQWGFVPRNWVMNEERRAEETAYKLVVGVGHCHLPTLRAHGCVWLKFHTAGMSLP